MAKLTIQGATQALKQAKRDLLVAQTGSASWEALVARVRDAGGLAPQTTKAGRKASKTKTGGTWTPEMREAARQRSKAAWAKRNGTKAEPSAAAGETPQEKMKREKRAKAKAQAKRTVQDMARIWKDSDGSKGDPVEEAFKILNEAQAVSVEDRAVVKALNEEMGKALAGRHKPRKGRTVGSKRKASK